MVVCWECARAVGRLRDGEEDVMLQRPRTGLSTGPWLIMMVSLKIRMNLQPVGF